VFTLVARLRGGVALVVSDNVKLESSADGRIHSLTIVSVSADDVGEYTVRATTDCAQISSAASIVIQRTCTWHPHCPKIRRMVVNCVKVHIPRNS